MRKRRHSAEQIVKKLREEIELALGGTRQGAIGKTSVRAKIRS